MTAPRTPEPTVSAQDSHVRTPHARQALPVVQAVELGPNVLGVSHWDRLLGGLLYAATPRIDWATLLRRTFQADGLECRKCRGRLRVLACVADAVTAREILGRLEIPVDVPRAARARDPTDEGDVADA